MRRKKNIVVPVARVDRGDYIDVITDEITMNPTFYKIYDGSLSVTAKINSLTRNLLDFLIESAGLDNRIYNNGEVKEDFLKCMSEFDITYNYRSIDRAFKILEEEGALIRKMKGLYYINPQYFWKDIEKTRFILARKLIDFKLERDEK